MARHRPYHYSTLLRLQPVCRRHLNSKDRWALSSSSLCPAFSEGDSAPALSNQRCPSLATGEEFLKADGAWDILFSKVTKGCWPPLLPFHLTFSYRMIKMQEYTKGIGLRTQSDKGTLKWSCGKIRKLTVEKKSGIMDLKVKVLVSQLCLTLCNPKDCSPSVSSVHGTLQARILEWVTIPFSRGSSWPRHRTQVSWIAGGFPTIWATREAHNGSSSSLFCL